MKSLLISGTLLLSILFSGCGSVTPDISPEAPVEDQTEMSEPFTAKTAIQDVIQDVAFGEYGRLIFPVNDHYYNGETLEDLQLTYYSHIDPNATV